MGMGYYLLDMNGNYSRWDFIDLALFWRCRKTAEQPAAAAHLLLLLDRHAKSFCRCFVQFNLGQCGGLHLYPMVDNCCRINVQKSALFAPWYSRSSNEADIELRVKIWAKSTNFNVYLLIDTDILVHFWSIKLLFHFLNKAFLLCEIGPMMSVKNWAICQKLGIAFYSFLSVQCFRC